VAKLTPDLKKIAWCTYVGGSGDDTPRGGLAIDDWDNVYVVGGTGSSDFPRTSGVFQRIRSGEQDAAIVKLKPDGSGLVFSTLLGGSSSDGTMGVAVDASGEIYVAGHTGSTDFPVTVGAPQPRLGGQSDCYLAKLSSDASKLIYSTYLGGRLGEFAEHRHWLARDGSVLLTGFVGSPDFPIAGSAFQTVLKGASDGFVTKLSADGRRFLFSTFLGGSGSDFWLMPTLDEEGNIYVVGQTSSPDFPTTPDAFQAKYSGGSYDGALAILSPDGSAILYATYLGGRGDEMVRSITLGKAGEIFVVGNTGSEDFPVTRNAYQEKHAGDHDAFVVKFVRTRETSFVDQYPVSSP
jgi:hypothetical protein